jgi:hypothetical protein
MVAGKYLCMCPKDQHPRAEVVTIEDFIWSGFSDINPLFINKRQNAFGVHEYYVYKHI